MPAATEKMNDRIAAITNFLERWIIERTLL
jgi:hypothetical protein